MNRMPQPDLHPDPDVLNAFVEQALSGAEQARILAHMAGCERCREIVYLARGAADPQIAARTENESVPAAISERRPGWFSAAFARWRLALVPAAALASVGAVILWVQFHPAPPRVQMAESSPQAPPARTGAPSTAVTQSRAPAPSDGERSVARQVESGQAAKPMASERVSGNETKKSAVPVPEIAAMRPSAAAPSIAATEEPRREAAQVHLDAHSASLARYIPSAPEVGPPALSSFNPANAQAEQQRQNAKSVPNASAAGPAVLAAAPPPAAAPAPAPANILTVHGSLTPPPAEPSPVAVQSQPAAELAPEPMNGFATTLRLASRAKLPSGLNTISSAALLNRLLAVDSAGSVFLSEDGGARWERVAAQWSGKPVTVQAPSQRVHARAAIANKPLAGPESTQPKPAGTVEENADTVPLPPSPDGADAAVTMNAIKTPVPPIPGLFFRLITDRHQVWISADGKVWHRQ